MTLRDQKRQDGSSSKKRAKSSKGADVQHNYQYGFSADNGAGTCAMAASVREILQESRFQRQAVDRWGHDSSSRDRTTTTSPLLSSPVSSSSSSSSGTSSPYARSSSTLPSGYAGDTHDPRSFRAVVGISPIRLSHPSEQGREAREAARSQDGDAITRPRPELPAESALEQRPPRPSYPYPSDATKRDLGGLNAELHNLRMHLLQRANGTYVP